MAGNKGGGSGSSTVSQSNAPPPAFMNAYQGLVSNAQQTASRPYTPYGGSMVADFNPTQNQAFGMINNSANLAQPDIAAATGIFKNNANSNLWGQLPQLNSADINQYLNPYTQDVTQATQAQFANLNAQQQSSLIGNAINSGAFGGDRAAVAQGILGGQQAAQEAPILAGIQQQGYNTALQTAQQQQGAQLGALEAQGWLGSQSAFGLGQLGGESQNLAESGAQSILGAGNMQQQLAQEQLNVPFYQYQAQQAYPFQTQNWLANIVEGAGGAAGGTGTTQTNLPNQNNMGSTLFGEGLSAAAVAAMFMEKGGRIPYRAPGGGILPQGIPIYPRRAPGGGILDYMPGGGGSTGGILDYVPDMGASGMRHGSGPPPAPRSTPAYGPQQPDIMSQIMPLMGMASSKRNSGRYAAQNGGLGADELSTLSATSPGDLARGGGIFARRGYDDGGAVDDMDLTSPEVGEGAVPLRYVENSPYQDPNWRGPSSRRVDDPRVTDIGNYALDGDFPADGASASASPGILPPAKKDDTYGYDGYQAPNRASSGIAPWKLGLLGAGLGILSHGTKQHPLGGAEEGLRAYAQAQGEQDRTAEQEAARADESAYRKANLKREGEQFSANLDISKQRLKQQGEAQAETAQYHTGELDVRGREAAAREKQASATEAWRQSEASRGYFEPSAPVLGADGKPKLDPASGAPLYTWTNRYDPRQTRQGPYDPTTGGGRGGKGESASQWKYNAWLAAHEGDTQGALDFVAGHKQMGEGDVAKAAHAMAQGDYKTLFGDGSRPAPKDAEGWLAERRTQYEQQLRAGRQPGQSGPPGGASDPLGIR